MWTSRARGRLMQEDVCSGQTVGGVGSRCGGGKRILCARPGAACRERGSGVMEINYVAVEVKIPPHGTNSRVKREDSKS